MKKGVYESAEEETARQDGELEVIDTEAEIELFLSRVSNPIMRQGIRVFRRQLEERKGVTMSEAKHLYIGRHWPAPKEQPKLTISSHMCEKIGDETEAGRLWDYHIKVESASGRSFGQSGAIRARDEKSAEIDVLYKIIGCVADAAAEMLP